MGTRINWKNTQKIQELIPVGPGFSLVQFLPPHLSVCTSPSLGSVYGRPINRRAPLRCGFPPKVLASAIAAGSGSPEVIVKVHMCASIRRCHSLGFCTRASSLSHLLPPSSRQDLRDLEVGYVRLHRQCLCGSVYPAIGLQGYVSDVSSVTALLDR